MIALFNLWRRESGRLAVEPIRGLEPETLDGSTREATERKRRSAIGGLAPLRRSPRAQPPLRAPRGVVREVSSEVCARVRVGGPELGHGH